KPSDLAHVVLEPLQLRDLRLVDHGAVPHDAYACAATYDAGRHYAPRDRAEARHLEERANFGLAERLLVLDRAEPAAERLPDVVRQGVDDAGRAHFDDLATRQRSTAR